MKKPPHLAIKIQKFFLFSRKGSIFGRCVSERQAETNGDRGRRIESATLTLNFLLFLTIARCVIFKAQLSISSASEPEESTQPEVRCDPLVPARSPATRWHSL